MKIKEMQLWKCDLKIPCHVASCRGRAAWYLGKPEKRYDALILCDKCAKELVSNVPSELLETTDQKEVVEEKHEEEVVNEEKASLSKLGIRELRDIAKSKGMKGYSSLDKESLIAAIEGAEQS